MDWLPELADDDLATLMEALEAWEHKDAANEILSDVVDMVLPAPGSPFLQQRSQQRLDLTRAKAARKERSVLLRAKLLTLRDRRRTDRLERRVLSDEDATNQRLEDPRRI